MTVVSMYDRTQYQAPSPEAVAQARTELAANTDRPNEQRRRDRERKRAWRFLKRGGVILREDLGGAVGVRWTKASRSGAFDAAVCNGWLTRGRLAAADELANGYRWAGASA